jgi:hypothetical protein
LRIDVLGARSPRERPCLGRREGLSRRIRIPVVGKAHLRDRVGRAERERDGSAVGRYRSAVDDDRAGRGRREIHRIGQHGCRRRERNSRRCRIRRRSSSDAQGISGQKEARLKGLKDQRCTGGKLAGRIRITAGGVLVLASRGTIDERSR